MSIQPTYEELQPATQNGKTGHKSIQPTYEELKPKCASKSATCASYVSSLPMRN